MDWILHYITYLPTYLPLPSLLDRLLAIYYHFFPFVTYRHSDGVSHTLYTPTLEFRNGILYIYIYIYLYIRAGIFFVTTFMRKTYLSCLVLL